MSPFKLQTLLKIDKNGVHKQQIPPKTKSSNPILLINTAYNLIKSFQITFTMSKFLNFNLKILLLIQFTHNLNHN